MNQVEAMRRLRTSTKQELISLIDELDEDQLRMLLAEAIPLSWLLENSNISSFAIWAKKKLEANQS